VESARKESRLITKSGLLIAAGLCIFSAASQAQGRPEARADAIISNDVGVYAGAGLLFPVGTYLRTGIVAAAGVMDGSAAFRADLVNVFHLDPFRESSWAPYAGGGLSFLYDTGEARTQARLLALIGVEGPLRNGKATAFEVGLGGGVRVAVILRKAQARSR
jgi:hypothetical protein